MFGMVSFFALHDIGSDASRLCVQHPREIPQRSHTHVNWRRIELLREKRRGASKLVIRPKPLQFLSFMNYGDLLASVSKLSKQQMLFIVHAAHAAWLQMVV